MEKDIKIVFKYNKSRTTFLGEIQPISKNRKSLQLEKICHLFCLERHIEFH